jgi:hypothetical protein
MVAIDNQVVFSYHGGLYRPPFVGLAWLYPGFVAVAAGSFIKESIEERRHHDNSSSHHGER